MLLVYGFALALFTLIFTREVIAPASGATCDKRWRLFAGGLNAGNVAAVLAAGWLFSPQLAEVSIFSISERFGAFTASLIVFGVTSFVTYWSHRATHGIDYLWRCVHQLHHSPSRIETLTAFYLHPLDSFIATVLNAVIAFGILGASVEAAALSFGYVAVFNLVAHADQKTPWVMGFFIQRPEMHRIHHERGSHRNNYGLPVWDMIFGTWRNPRHSRAECGFDPENQYRVREMLQMKVVQD